MREIERNRKDKRKGRERKIPPHYEGYIYFLLGHCIMLWEERRGMVIYSSCKLLFVRRKTFYLDQQSYLSIVLVQMYTLIYNVIFN